MASASIPTYESGLTGFLDKITGDIDQAAANRDQLRGLSAGGVLPGQASPGPSTLSQIQSMFGLGLPPQINAAPTQSAPAAQAALPTFAALQGNAPTPGLQNLFSAAEKNYNLPAGYLAKTAAIESQFDPNAVSPTGAQGPFQFTKGTAAQYGVTNPTDWVQSTQGAARLAADNSGVLSQALGRAPTAGELYLAHQQGAGAAVALLKNPNAPAGAVLASIGVNPRNIVVNGGDPNAPAGAFASKFVSRFDGSGPGPAAPQGAMAYAPGNGGTPPAVAPAASAITGAMLPVGAPSAVPAPPQSAPPAPAPPMPDTGPVPAPDAPPSAAPAVGGMVGMRAAAGLTPPAAPPPSAPQQVAAAGPQPGPGPAQAAPQAPSASPTPAPPSAAPPIMPVATSDNGSIAQGRSSSPQQAAPPQAAPLQVAPQTDISGRPLLGAGATPPNIQQIQALIQNPATRALGLQLWQTAISPAAPITVKEGDTLLSPRTGQPLYTNQGKDLKAQQIGEDQFGNKAFGVINERTGTVAPIAPQSGNNNIVAAINSGKTGPELLASLPTSMAGQVKSIAEGRAPAPQGQSLRTPMGQALNAAVNAYDPSFESGNGANRNAVRTDFSKGPTANAITAGNTAIQHLADIAAAVPELGNFDTGIPGNNIANQIGNAIGQSRGRAVAVNKFNTAVGDFAGELTKFYRGAGGSEADLNRVFQDLNTNQSPSQLKAAIQQQMILIGGKVNALQDRWRQGMGPAVADFPILSKTTQGAVDQINRMSPANAVAPAAPHAATASPPQAGVGLAAQAAQAPVRVSTPEEAMALAPGTPFMTPDNQIRVRH